MDQIFSPEKSQGPPVNPSKQELEKDPKRSTEEGGPQAENVLWYLKSPGTKLQAPQADGS